MLRFALNSLESVASHHHHPSVYVYIYYLIGHAKLELWFLRHFFEERLRRDNCCYLKDNYPRNQQNWRKFPPAVEILYV